MEWLEKGFSIVMRGPRQAGKTTLLLYLREQIGGEYVTLEDPEERRLIRNIKLFASVHRDELLYIDEAQYDSEIGRKVKYLIDVEKRRVVVSGSGSFDVKVKVGGELVGRAHTVVLLPLSFGEMVLWKRKKYYDLMVENRKLFADLLKGKDVELYDLPLESIYEEYSLFGGYPRVVLGEEKETLLKDLLNLYIERDVGFFLGVLKRKNFEEFVEVLAKVQGSPLNLSSISQSLGISYETLRRYLSLLQETLIVKEIRAYGGGLREHRRSRKIYFLDQGLRNCARGGYFVDGSTYEASVLRFLSRFGRVYYLRKKSGAEVDFLLKYGSSLVPVEVKSTCRATRVLRNFPSKVKIVFCNEMKREGDVVYLPLWSVG